ncbi:MAG: hypothetical protein RMJ55_20415, partial [Roseiflexaceae bacterium]|nr:hypothetical protein [Roseiflexaceae bacterium]
GCVEDFVDLQTQAGQQGKAIAGLAIIEIMTTSTSGGNKQAQSSINQACAQALAGQNHQAPSINKRQVIGRMLSQFFAKSAVAKQWGGHAVWVIQEPLANYISSSTALNISTGNQAFRSNLNDVNMAIVSYDSSQQNQTPKQLALSRFVTGQLLTYNPTAFENILLAPFCPNIVILIEALAKQKPKIVPVP